MNRSKRMYHRYLLLGLGLIVAGLIVSLPVKSVGAQDDDAAEYIGAGDCQDCHRSLARDHEETPHALAFQEVARNQDNVLADFEQGADVRTVQFPGEDAPRPFTADDIAFVIGSGRYAQRYLYAVDDDVYAVLPAEWDTVAQVWRPYLLAASWPAPEYDWVQNCAGCHTTGLEIERGRWEDEGVQCEACHGPGSIHAELADDAGSRPDDDELLEIHAAIVVSPDPQICGQCHNQGVQFDTAHPYPTTYRPGGTLAAAPDAPGFQLVPEDDTSAWYASGHARLSNMQYNEWLASGHAESLDTLQSNANAQDGCVTCHSGDYAFTERIRGVYEDGDLSGEPPASTTLATAQYGITCVTCHSPHGGAENDFLLEQSTYDLCTSCHRNTELVQPVHHPVVEMFEGQPVLESVAAVPSAHFAAEDGPRCVTCHMPEVVTSTGTLASHLWQPVIPAAETDSPPDACSACHTDLLATDLQSLVEDTQASVRSRLSVARARLGSITPPAEGTAERADYDRVVTVLAFVQNDGSLGVHNYAYADALLDETAVLLAKLSVPGASLEPTEGPAPTATPAQPQPITVGMELPARTGLRPMTFVIIGFTALILLAGSALILYRARRRARRSEVIS